MIPKDKKKDPPVAIQQNFLIFSSTKTAAA
jgi:hypothetical protein